MQFFSQQDDLLNFNVFLGLFLPSVGVLLSDFPESNDDQDGPSDLALTALCPMERLGRPNRLAGFTHSALDLWRRSRTIRR